MAPLAHITWREYPRTGTLWYPVAALALAGQAPSMFAAMSPPTPAAPPRSSLRLEIPRLVPLLSSIVSSLSGPCPVVRFIFISLSFFFCACV